MLPEHAERIKQAVAEFEASSFDTPYDSTQFFVKWIQGANVYNPVQPWESYRYNIDLLRSLHDADPAKLAGMHKGTPFFFLAFTSFDVGAYDRALFYLDAALAEDMRGSPEEWKNLPAAKLIRLEEHARTAADRIIPGFRTRLDQQLQRFRTLTRSKAKAVAGVDDFVRLFVKALLTKGSPEGRHLVVGLYAWLFEYDDLYSGLILRGRTKTSVLPVLSHLFRGGLLLESLLKLHYQDYQDWTLGRIFKSPRFKSDFGSAPSSSPADKWGDIPQGKPNSSPGRAFSVTGKLRNFLGHNLVRRDVFADPDRYRNYFEHEVDALFHVIARKY